MTNIDLRRKALDGLIDATASMHLGIYPAKVAGVYSERTEWMDGWNAAVTRQNQYVLQIYAWLRTIPPEHLTQVEDLLLKGTVELSVGDSDGVHLVYICHDVFYLGYADCEDLPIEELKDLVACIEECPKWGGELWVARKRKERPQGAVLECMSQEDQRLFNVCGPAKPVGL
jgi:hypothetical protein